MLTLSRTQTRVDGFLSLWLVVEGARASAGASCIGIGINVGTLCRLNDLLWVRNDWRRRSAGGLDVRTRDDEDLDP